MKHRKHLLTIATITAILAAPAAAQAGSSPVTPDVFGNGGGDPVPLSATCQRLPVHIPFGRTWLRAKPGVISAFTIIDTELKCVTFHLQAVGKCWETSVPPVSLWRKDDWKGVDQLDTYIQQVRSCTLAATGVSGS